MKQEGIRTFKLYLAIANCSSYLLSVAKKQLRLICETHRNPLQFNVITVDLFCSASQLQESLRTGIPVSAMRFLKWLTIRLVTCANDHADREEGLPIIVGDDISSVRCPIQWLPKRRSEQMKAMRAKQTAQGSPKGIIFRFSSGLRPLYRGIGGVMGNDSRGRIYFAVGICAVRNSQDVLEGGRNMLREKSLV